MRAGRVFVVLAASMLVACGGGTTPAAGDQGGKDTYVIAFDTIEDRGTLDPGGSDPGSPYDPGTYDPGTPPDPGPTDPGVKPDPGMPDIHVNECEKDEDCATKVGVLDACHEPACEASTHTCLARPKLDGAACDDGSACTRDDFCSAGTCKGKELVCDDSNPCTDNVCDPATGCRYTNNSAPCDDGNACTGTADATDVCKDGLCVGGTNTCECTADKDCKPFQDPDLCKGLVKCTDNKCAIDPSTIVSCDASGDGPCKVTTCDPAKGACVAIISEDGKACDDGDACTQAEACQAGACGGGAAVTCVDENACTTDSCDPNAGCVFVNNTEACDDGNACTTGDTCANGTCQPGALDEVLCPTTCKPGMSLFCDVSHKRTNDGEGSTNVANGYACSEADFSGPEYTYVFVAPYDGTFAISLGAEAVDTQVLVLEAGAGCDPAKCIASGEAQATFAAKAYTTYYLVVDGVAGAAGEFSIHVGCVPAKEIYCADGIDNDQDGLFDCEDKDDCLGTAECPLPVCVPDWELACGDSDTWATYRFGATDQVDTYSCNEFDYPGPEYAYSFASDKRQKVVVKLTGETGDTDVLILKDGADACDPTKCVDYGLTQTTFVAEAGETFHFVVDGFAGAEGKYTISITCSDVTEDDCGNGVDDDGDGSTDCADEDCVGATECPTCMWDYVLECGDTDYYNNGDLGSTNVVDAYSCTGELSYGAPEYTYLFIADSDQAVTLTLSNETAETDVLVLEAAPYGVCNPMNCLDWGTDSVTFEAKAGGFYYIVVDGWSGGVDPDQVGDYQIDVTCL